MTTDAPRYKGWFGLCPVWIRFIGHDGVELEERYPLTGWLFWLSEKIMGAAIFFTSMLNPGWEPQWPFRITDPDYDPGDP